MSRAASTTTRSALSLPCTAEGLRLRRATANARDIETEGPGVTSRFNAPPGQLLWSYGCSVVIVCDRLGPEDSLAAELKAAFERFERTIGERCGIVVAWRVECGAKATELAEKEA